MTRSSSVVTRHDRRGSCVVMTADGLASSLTAARVRRVLRMSYLDLQKKLTSVTVKMFDIYISFTILCALSL